MHVVVALGAEDRAYLDEHTVGWERLAARLAQFPPPRVAEITGIDEARIAALGERLAFTRPTGIRATMGLQRHAGGGMALRALASLCAVTGDWRHPGGGLVYSTSGYFRGNRQALFRDDLRSRPVRELVMTRLGDGLLEVADPPVKALVIYGANPLASNPHTNRIRQGLAREDLFTVVIEQFPTDTVDYADIVLPSTMQTEHLDVHDGYGHLYLAWNEPVEPPVRIALATPERCWAIADPGGVAQIVRILLDNALRHSPRGAAVRVEVALHGGIPMVSVSDAGPGVAPDDRERIFKRFERGRETAGDSGFGLGLAIGRELARRMDGDLRLDATGTGARFVLVLVAAPADELEAP
jgi:anaerobic selenocysteine-containing dehydrogenase